MTATDGAAQPRDIAQIVADARRSPARYLAEKLASDALLAVTGGYWTDYLSALYDGAPERPQTHRSKQAAAGQELRTQQRKQNDAYMAMYSRASTRIHSLVVSSARAQALQINRNSWREHRQQEAASAGGHATANSNPVRAQNIRLFEAERLGSPCLSNKELRTLAYEKILDAPDTMMFCERRTFYVHIKKHLGTELVEADTRST